LPSTSAYVALATRRLKITIASRTPVRTPSGIVVSHWPVSSATTTAMRIGARKAPMTSGTTSLSWRRVKLNAVPICRRRSRKEVFSPEGAMR
jgi:hypothetical protein